jgi:formiminotetrahydrofolate cyclodeaminase
VHEKLIGLPLHDVLAAFSAPQPTPGGGSAAALGGALGASLIAMVARLPKARAATDADRAALLDAAERSTTLATALAEAIDRDSDAYEQVMAAYRLPKETDEHKRARSAAIQDGLRTATEVPLGVMRACAAAIDAAAVVAALGNASASSDVQVGVELLTAGLRGARLNVDANLQSVKDAEYVARVRQSVSELGRAAASQS